MIVFGESLFKETCAPVLRGAEYIIFLLDFINIYYDKRATACGSVQILLLV